MQADPVCCICGCREGKSLVRCPQSTLYACNTVDANKGSHIIQHLRRRNHNKIEMHQGSLFPNLVIECCECHKSNIYDLVLVEKRNDYRRHLMCIHEIAKFPQDYVWEDYFPLVMNKAINPVLVPVPTEVKKEKDSPNKENTPTAQPDQSKHFMAKEKYKDISEFIQIMRQAIQIEIDYDFKNSKTVSLQGTFNIKDLYISVNFRGYKSVHAGSQIEVFISGYKERIHFTVSRTVYPFTIYLKADNPDLIQQLRSRLKINTTSCKIKPVFSPATYDRQITALYCLPSCDNFFQAILTGNMEYPTQFESLNACTKYASYVPNPIFSNMNSSQKHAIERAFSKRFSYIQGPPGTGKTTTLTCLVYSYVMSTEKKVLVLAHSNAAVSNCYVKLGLAGLAVERYQSRAFGDPHIKNEVSNKKPILVTCATISSSCQRLCMSNQYDLVVIDEGSQVPDPDLAIALSHKCKYLVIFGDHQQLSPVIKAPQLSNGGFDISIIARMIKNGYEPSVLRTQYRMHPEICDVSNRLIYRGKTKSGVTSEDRKMQHSFIQWPNPHVPVMFWHADSKEMVASDTLGYHNRKEVAMVIDLLKSMLRSGVDPADIKVITPYIAQISEILDQIITELCPQFPQHENLYEKIIVDTVDTFQGQEGDYFILTNVRSNDIHDIGFLSDKRRLNVSITRAKLGLIIIGNIPTLSNDKTWRNMFDILAEKNVIVKGRLSSLEPYVWTPSVDD